MVLAIGILLNKIKETVSIPVFANGGIRYLSDVQECLDYTGCDGVMTSEAILENPAFFSPEWKHIEQVMLEYIDFAEKYNENINTVRSHVYKSFYGGFKVHKDLREKITTCTTYEDFRLIAQELYERRKDEDPESKIEWYHRYWKGHETEPAHIDSDFNEFIDIMDQKIYSGGKVKENMEDESISQVWDLFTEEEY